MTWAPWRPDDYPIKDALHNPWMPVDPISGATAYSLWLDVRPISEEDFRKLLDEMRSA